ncbi:winged helix-turn-helix transcriptional regulator [Hoeflea olei]|uniref:HxlR family transcriptional regulator n=1 Tax=Hoeflea olei TaxID=1480615 RepID=A0A1C1YSM6_9HYPH|nr:helix-turn-helix domain-containing protein [Hoeflea olei]OCW56494.1 HxlR family transcriptional regulator [Hoeflea olei]
MDAQEGTFEQPGHPHETAACAHISRMLERISDKWTLLVVRTLANGPLRFNALRREVGGVSQKMLASTLRGLEENGLVLRTVTQDMPPMVEYELTDLGHDFVRPVDAFAEWVIQNTDRIETARAAYAARRALK